MSEEAKRLTRQRKADAKAAKVSYTARRVAPSYIDQSVYSIPYLACPGRIAGTHVPGPSRFSNAASLPAYSPVPPAPSMPSPPLESPWPLGRAVPVINDPPMVIVPAQSPMTHQGIYEVAEASGYATYNPTPVSCTESPSLPSDPIPITPLDKRCSTHPLTTRCCLTLPVRSASKSPAASLTHSALPLLARAAFLGNPP